MLKSLENIHNQVKAMYATELQSQIDVGTSKGFNEIDTKFNFSKFKLNN